MLVLKWHRKWVRSVTFSPDGCRLASSAGREEYVSLWDAAQGKRLASLPAHGARIASLAVIPDEGLLAAAELHGDVQLWDMATGTACARIARPERVRGSTYALAFAAMTRLLAVGAVCEMIPGQSSWAYRVDLWQGMTWEKGPTLQGRVRQDVSCLAFSPDGGTLAVGCQNQVHLWDVSQSRPVGPDILSQRDTVRAVSYAPDGGLLAIATGRCVVLWDAAASQPRRTLRGHRRLVTSMAFSPDGRTLLSGSHDRTVRLWAVSSGYERSAFDWQIGRVHAVAFAPDGMRAAAGGDADIVLWDVEE